MTVNEKREPPLSVGFDIVREYREKALSQGILTPPDLGVWLASRITEAVNAARPGPGMTVVPVEASEAMWQAGREADANPGDSYSAVWRAMVAAVDDPPPSP